MSKYLPRSRRLASALPALSACRVAAGGLGFALTMTRWEYTTLTLRIAAGAGKTPGYFNRPQAVRNVTEESERDLNLLGNQGWELVSVLLLDLGSMDHGPNYAAALLKRPIEEPSAS